ncbi:SEC-C metal-binding domain-containing protein [Peribacillus acanthi]|uniref:SEC-C metal-binding domain-containing protein n=1 Tax=Peribacillus acanthi TaxID=2171554 RepID=UPI0013008793|nr:SEC-C metal-binding domain-containing protein [Peribacillus acanthi]
MTNFLERMEQALLNEDQFVQQYAVRILKDSYLLKTDTLLTALKGVDIGLKNKNRVTILPHIDFLPISEAGLKEIIKRFESEPKLENKHWYAKLLLNASTNLLLSYRNELPEYINRGFLESLEKMKSLDNKQLSLELIELAQYLDENGHQPENFSLAKRMMDELLSRGENLDVKLENGLQSKLNQNNFLSFEGIFMIYLIGELRNENMITELVDILCQVDDYLAHEEAMKALIKIGTDAVVNQVEQIAFNENSYFYTIDILGKIKSKSAHEALLRLFSHTTNKSIQTLIADALCQHLSVEAIPLVENMLQNGYDKSLLDLEEPLYVNLILNKIDKPYLNNLRMNLLAEDRRLEDLQQHMVAAPPAGIKETVGRNDPCPCGSGKKYKKCCL